MLDEHLRNDLYLAEKESEIKFKKFKLLVLMLSLLVLLMLSDYIPF